MQPTDDRALLRQYAENNSDEAFAALVTRHINLVYSVALRQVGNPHAAEEITQAVFIILAKKAAQLRHDKALSSWLFQATRLTANNFIRSEARRHHREEEAYMQSVLDEAGTEIWPRIAPLLDSAVAGLREKDRQAIVLRFYEGRNLREIGLALGTSEDAAEKRVSRALEKLRKFFTKRGVSSTTAIIAGTISAHSVQAAPTALAKSVTAIAVAKGAAASASTLTLINGALKIMAWTKAKTAIVVGVGVLLAAGTTTVAVKRTYDSRMYSWRVPKFDPVNNNVLWKAPPQVRILPTKFSKFGGASCYDSNDPTNATCMGICESAETIVNYAYLSFPPRIVFLTDLPKGNYDFIANLPHDSMKALQDEVKKKFGLIGKKEMRETDVLILQLSKPEIQAFKSANSLKRSMDITDPNIKSADTPRARNGTSTHTWFDVTLEESLLRDSLESQFRLPIIDETGLTNQYDFSFMWPVFRDNDNEAHNRITNKALLDQLGLELIPAKRNIEMLVVERAQ